MVISVRIAVLDKGKLIQLCKPYDIYSKPSNIFESGFMGTTNFIYGTVVGEVGEHTSVMAKNGFTSILLKAGSLQILIDDLGQSYSIDPQGRL